MCHLVLLLPLAGVTVFWLLPLQLALPTYILVLLASFLLYQAVIRAMRRPLRYGPEAIIGERAVVVMSRGNRGIVSLASDLWSARALGGAPLRKGQQVVVQRREGNRLVVLGSAGDVEARR